MSSIRSRSKFQLTTPELAPETLLDPEHLYGSIVLPLGDESCIQPVLREVFVLDPRYLLYSTRSSSTVVEFV